MSESHEIAIFDPVTRVISPSDLAKRVDPITQTGTIYRDKNGIVRAILVFQLSESILQAFDHSGFNLAKAVLAEVLAYGRQNNFVDQVRRNLWDADFSAGARIISDRLSFFSLAITSRGSVDGTVGVTELLQSWLQQGHHYAAVRDVANSLAINKRSTSDAEFTERDFFPSKWCNDGILGFYNTVVDKPVDIVSIKTGCPAA